MASSYCPLWIPDTFPTTTQSYGRALGGSRELWPMICDKHTHTHTHIHTPTHKDTLSQACPNTDGGKLCHKFATDRLIFSAGQLRLCYFHIFLILDL